MLLYFIQSVLGSTTYDAFTQYIGNCTIEKSFSLKINSEVACSMMCVLEYKDTCVGFKYDGTTFGCTVIQTLKTGNVVKDQGFFIRGKFCN